MEMFEAADKFLELFEKHPLDFTVKTDNGRDHSYIIITNKYRAVEVTIDVRGNKPSAASGGNSDVVKCIRFISQGTVDRLHELAMKRMDDDRTQRQVDADNKAITNLFDYYDNK